AIQDNSAASLAGRLAGSLVAAGPGAARCADGRAAGTDWTSPARYRLSARARLRNGALASGRQPP
ncbi:MAG TPA: hypothetical protein VKB62_03785, partial [Streptosporangiaceae bacterium]|nr:hypothetical protein [Streptosporangiaceae bacterium]